MRLFVTVGCLSAVLVVSLSGSHFLSLSSFSLSLSLSLSLCVYAGDDDPIDVVEISGRPLPMGAVIPVRSSCVMFLFVFVCVFLSCVSCSRLL